MQRQKAKSDEWYTPVEAVHAIESFVKPFYKVWCPFDTEDSQFVKILGGTHQVIYSHIKTGQDFFETKIDCDVIVSNPPFSKRNEVYERLFELGKPFAMVGNMAGIFDSKNRYDMFQRNEFELLVMYPRVKFISPDDNSLKSPTYQSCYVCHQVLPRQIMFKKLATQEETQNE